MNPLAFRSFSEGYHSGLPIPIALYAIFCYYTSMKTILVDAVYAFVIENEGRFIINKDMHKMLEEFPNKKILLTGASDEKYKEFGLDNMPYEVFTLKNNPAKSESSYYEIMLKHFNLSKDDVVYFEHNEDAVKSAQSAGIITYYYNDEKMDLEGLKSYLTENL